MTGVAFDRGLRLLTVGEATRTVAPLAGNEEILAAYLEMVTAQRPVPPSSRVHLRDRDVEALAEVLDLDDTHLEDQLVGLLAVSREEASQIRLRLTLSRLRVAAAALGVGVLAAVPTTSAANPAAVRGATAIVAEPAAVAAAAPVTVAPAEPVDIGTAVQIVRDADGNILTYTETAPAPVAEDGTDIGTALTIEKSSP